MATTGGNLLQRTRCYYFRDTTAACNKRTPGSECAALDGYNRIHAVLGTSDHCIATHPSDMCVALAALDAVVHVHGPKGERAIAFGDFHTLPGDRPDVETALGPGEIVVRRRDQAVARARGRTSARGPPTRPVLVPSGCRRGAFRRGAALAQ